MEMHNDVFNYGCCHKYYGWSDLAWSEAEQLSQWAKLPDFTNIGIGSKFTNYRNYHLRINDGECMIISSYSTADSCGSSLRQKANSWLQWTLNRKIHLVGYQTWLSVLCTDLNYSYITVRFDMHLLICQITHNYGWLSCTDIFHECSIFHKTSVDKCIYGWYRW